MTSTPRNRPAVRGPRASRGWFEPASLRLLGSMVFLAVTAAVVTGPEGTARDFSYGFRKSVFAPRIVWFLLVGVGAWVLLRELGRLDLVGYRRRVREAVRLTPTAAGARRLTWALWGAVLLAAVLVPPQLSGFWQAVLINEIGLYALLALGLNVVVGFAGLLDLGYIAFFAIGSYLTAYFTGRLPVHPPFDLNPFYIFPLAVIAALAAGVLLGAPTLRLRGDYLAIVTLGFGEIVYQFALIKTDVTGGSSGAFNIPHFSVHVGGLKYLWGLGALPYYYLVLVFIVIVTVLFGRLERSRVGRAWAAIREDEVAAAAMGVATVKYKLMAFAIGASTSGLAGVVYASKYSTVTPDAFLLQNSILVLVLVIFGGMGSIWGVLAGAAILEWLPEVLRDYVPPSDRFVYFGALLIVMMIFRPQGLIPSRRRRREIVLHQRGLDEGDAMTAPPGGPAQERGGAP